MSLTSNDIERAERSYASMGQLPANEVADLVECLAELTHDPAEIRSLVAGLHGPWIEVEATLSRLHDLAP